MSGEHLTPREELQRIIDLSCVENYPSGYSVRGNLKAYLLLQHLDEHQIKIAHLLGHYDLLNRGYTFVIHIPLWSSHVTRKISLPSDFDRLGYVALLYFAGINMDEHGKRRGPIRSLISFPEGFGELFFAEIAKSPQSVYELIKTVNQGPIINGQGKPMEIKPGPFITFLPNDKFGGRITKEFNSHPFPVSFIANC